VLAHARALMASHHEGLLDYLDAELCDTQSILEQAARTLDFSRPVAVMLIAILHAIGDHDDPYQIVATLLDAVPPGSCLALSHGASDIDAEQMAVAARRINRSSHQQFTPRSQTQVTRFFTVLNCWRPGWWSGSRNGGRSPESSPRTSRPCGAASPSSAKSASMGPAFPCLSVEEVSTRMPTFGRRPGPRRVVTFGAWPTP
jgi:S-adenosyl methyltransferase